MVSDEQIQCEIAAVLSLGPKNGKLYCHGHGWDDIEKFDRNDHMSKLTGKPFTIWACPPCSRRDDYAYNCGGVQEYEDWPTDRNASYELPHDDLEKYFEAQSEYMGGSKDSIVQGFCDAKEECLIWLLYKGRRWVECETCKGEMYIASQPDGEPDGCPECYKNKREGGEWKSTDREK